MNIEDAKQIVEHLRKFDVEAELREAYSGRGMFTKQTAGIVTYHIGNVYYAMGKLNMEFTRLRQDNMSGNVIVY